MAVIKMFEKKKNQLYEKEWQRTSRLHIVNKFYGRADAVCNIFCSSRNRKTMILKQIIIIIIYHIMIRRRRSKEKEEFKLKYHSEIGNILLYD